MNTDKHTPGPWRQSERDSDGVQAEDRDGEWTGVAMVSDPNDPMHRTPVSVANAKLIAAAPDMLAALRDLHAQALKFFRTEDRCALCDEQGKHSPRCEITKAAKAIARAEGSAE